MVSLEEIYQRDSSIGSISGMSCGWSAWWGNEEEEWRIAQME